MKKSHIVILLILSFCETSISQSIDSWKVISTPFSNCSNIFFWDKDSGYAYVSDAAGGELFITTDGAQSWNSLKIFPDTVDYTNSFFDNFDAYKTKESKAIFLDKNTVYIYGPRISLLPTGKAENMYEIQDFFKSNDGGKNWLLKRSKYDNYFNHQYRNLQAIKYLGKDTLILIGNAKDELGCNNCTYYYSTNDGDSLKEIYRQLSSSYEIFSLGNGVVISIKTKISESTLYGFIHFESKDDLSNAKYKLLDTSLGVYGNCDNYAPLSSKRFAGSIYQREINSNKDVHYYLYSIDNGKTFQKVLVGSQEYNFLFPFMQLSSLAKYYFSDSSVLYIIPDEYAGVYTKGKYFKVIQNLKSRNVTDINFAPDGETGYISTKENVIYKTDNKSGLDSLNNLSTAIRPAVNKLTASLFPNPANERLIITINSINVKQHYMIYNVQGKLIQEGHLTGEETFLDISFLSSGVYIFNMDDSYQKFIVVK